VFAESLLDASAAEIVPKQIPNALDSTFYLPPPHTLTIRPQLAPPRARNSVFSKSSHFLSNAIKFIFHNFQQKTLSLNYHTSPTPPDTHPQPNQPF